MKKLVFILLVSAFCTSCKTAKVAQPDFVGRLIAQFKSEAVSNPPRSIYAYTYQQQTVYFVPAICCDMPSQLFNEKGQLICRPDGGFSGKGDGKCTDFFSVRRDERLIWKDDRKR